jgi:hypothetical protein
MAGMATVAELESVIEALRDRRAELVSDIAGNKPQSRKAIGEVVLVQRELKAKRKDLAALIMSNALLAAVTAKGNKS